MRDIIGVDVAIILFAATGTGELHIRAGSAVFRPDPKIAVVNVTQSLDGNFLYVLIQVFIVIDACVIGDGSASCAKSCLVGGFHTEFRVNSEILAATVRTRNDEIRGAASVVFLHRPIKFRRSIGVAQAVVVTARRTLKDEVLRIRIGLAFLRKACGETTESIRFTSWRRIGGSNGHAFRNGDDVRFVVRTDKHRCRRIAHDRGGDFIPRLDAVAACVACMHATIVASIARAVRRIDGRPLKAHKDIIVSGRRNNLRFLIGKHPTFIGSGGKVGNRPVRVAGGGGFAARHGGGKSQRIPSVFVRESDACAKIVRPIPYATVKVVVGQKRGDFFLFLFPFLFRNGLYLAADRKGNVEFCGSI